MGLGEATARGAQSWVSCPVSRAHSDLCLRTLDNDSVWHALLRAPGYPPAWRRRIQGRLGVKHKLVSRAGHATVIGALQGVERAPVRSLAKNWPWVRSTNHIETQGPDWTPKPALNDGGRGGPAPTFLAGRATFECTRGPRRGAAVTCVAHGNGELKPPSLDIGRVAASGKGDSEGY